MTLTGICIPHRGRPAYLQRLARHLPGYLEVTRASGEYHIYVGHQVDYGYFNLAMARNVAALAAIDDGCDHLVVQDVDLLPVSGPDYSPNGIKFWFMSAGSVKLPAEVFLKVNGWNVQFKGWGSEDSEFQNRIVTFVGEPVDGDWPKSAEGRRSVIYNLDLEDKPGVDWRILSRSYFHYDGAAGPLYLPLPESQRDFPVYGRQDRWLVSDKRMANAKLNDHICGLPTNRRMKLFREVGFNLIDRSRLQRHDDGVTTINFSGE